MPATPVRERSTALPTLQEVDRAHAELRRFYRLGRQSLRRYPQKILPRGVIEESAREAGLGVEFMRKARALARPGSGYSPQQFESLCAMAREQRYILGIGLVLRLLSVPKPQRPALQRRVIRERWNRRRLERFVRQQFGRRTPGGRRMSRAADVGEVHVQLEQLGKQWRGLCRQLREADESEDEQQDQGPGLNDLTPATRRRVDEVDRAMAELLKHLGRRIRPTPQH